MPLGYARRTFAGADYYVTEYLNLEDGEPLVIVHPNVNEGWILAAKTIGGQWCTGWIPATYWATQKVEEHRLEDFFCEETYGNLADVIVKYLGRAGPGTSPSRYSPAADFRPFPAKKASRRRAGGAIWRVTSRPGGAQGGHKGIWRQLT